jgi:hypothetical protein
MQMVPEEVELGDAEVLSVRSGDRPPDEPRDLAPPKMGDRVVRPEGHVQWEPRREALALRMRHGLAPRRAPTAGASRWAQGNVEGELHFRAEFFYHPGLTIDAHPACARRSRRALDAADAVDGRAEIGPLSAHAGAAAHSVLDSRGQTSPPDEPTVLMGRA